MLFLQVLFVKKIDDYMKNFKIISAGIFVTLSLLASCQKISNENTGKDDCPVFEDLCNAPALDIKGDAAKFATILPYISKETALQYGNSFTLSPAHYDEIKKVADALAGDTQTQTFLNFQKWFSENIAYGNSSSNDAYHVLVEKKAVCQGFANLFKAMCLSQNIPVLGINGLMYENGQGHAWTYVLVDSVWYVADPTNSCYYKAVEELHKYSDFLLPLVVDADLFEDEYFVYGYNSGLNINKVKKANMKNALNLSAECFSYAVSSFVPVQELPSDISYIYLSSAYDYLGPDYSALNRYCSGVRAIKISADNGKFRDHEGILYMKNSHLPEYIPESMTEIKLADCEVFGKNEAVFSKINARIIWFPANTRIISSYAVENCPNLEKIYVPEEAEFEKNSFIMVGNAIVTKF